MVRPMGCPDSMRWDGEAHVLNVFLEPRLVPEVAGSLGADLDGAEIVLAFQARDPNIERIGLLLKDELETGGLGGKLYAGSLANALAVHLLREHSSLGEKAKRRAAREPEGGLSARALKRATARIGDDLADDLSLAELARPGGQPLALPLRAPVQGVHRPQPAPVRHKRARGEGQGAAVRDGPLRRRGRPGLRLLQPGAPQPPLQARLRRRAGRPPPRIARFRKRSARTWNPAGRCAPILPPMINTTGAPHKTIARPPSRSGPTEARWWLISASRRARVA